MGSCESSAYRTEYDVINDLLEAFSDLNYFEKLVSKALVGHCHHKRETDTVVAEIAGPKKY
jgi:hypothetical protein